MVGYRGRWPLLHDRVGTVEDRSKEPQDDQRLDGFHGVTTALGAALMLGPAGHEWTFREGENGREGPRPVERRERRRAVPDRFDSRNRCQNGKF
jgi:hypothetical protein